MNREDPLNQRGLIAVNASAGSGKTYALAKRYISLFLSQEKNRPSFKNILAITFTNKASKEMKQRIIQFFKETAFGTKEAREILSPLSLTKAVQKRAGELVDEMLSNYDFFQVKTIDSFMSSLLKACAFRLGRSASYETKTEHGEYLLKSLDREIEKALVNKKTKILLDSFLERLMFIENRLSWFPKEDILKILEQLMAQTSSLGKDFVSADNSTAQVLLKLKKKVYEKLKELYDNLPQKTNSIFRNKLGTLFGKEGEVFSFEDLPKNLADEDFPINKGGDISPKVQDLWESSRKGLMELATKEAYSFFNNYIEIFREVYDTFEENSKKEDILFLTEFNRQIKSIFDSGREIIPEVYYRLSSRYLHFLIDEFQDTSRLQWENLRLLVREALSNGGSFFYVGDKKQAIYGFRGGNAALFDEVGGELNEFERSSINLSENYRSQKAIVEFNNLIFSAENLRGFFRSGEIGLEEKYEAEIENIFSNSRQLWQKDKNDGYVSLEKIELENGEEEDYIREKLKSCIEDLRKRFYPFKNIAILARDNAQVELLTSWLIEDGVPAESEKTLNIRENSLIKEMLSLIAFLNSPIDNFSFASFILGNIFMKASLIPEKEIEYFIFANNPRVIGKKEYLYRVFRERYPEVWGQLLEPFFISVGTLPLYEFAVNIYSAYRVLENFPEQHLFFISFLELIKEKSKENPGLAFFLEYFLNAEPKDLFVRSVKADAVKVLTIHSAKGLQFPVVINPFFKIIIKNSGIYYLPSEKGLYMIPIKEKRDRFSDELSRFESLDAKENCINELNTAYVALTRAKEELYVWVTPKAANKKNLAIHLFPEEKYEEGVKNIYKPKKGGLREIKIDPKNYFPLDEFLKEEKEDISKITRRGELEYGSAIHYALSFLGDLSRSDTKTEIEKAVNRAALKFGSDHKDILIRKITGLVNSEKLKGLFFDKKSEIFNEKEIIIKNGQTRIIDRLIISSDKAVIIDYKSTKEDSEEHIKQIREYGELIAGIYPDKKLECYIMYLDSETLFRVS